MENIQQAGISHSLRSNRHSDQDEVSQSRFRGRNIARMLMDNVTTDSEVIDLILRREADLETENPDYFQKWRPIYIAARYAKLAVVESLIEAGVDITNTNENGETALHSAVDWGSLDIVKALLAAEVGLFTIGGKTLFDDEEDTDVLSYPLINMTNSHGDTALVLACSVGREDKLKALLEAGASTKIGNPVLTATANVSEHGESKTKRNVEMLIEYKSNPDKWHLGIGPTPLFDLIRFNKPLSVVKLLVKNGANLYVRDDRGDTPYSLLVERYGEESEELNELRSLAKFPSLKKLSVNSVAKHLHNESDVDELHLPDKRKFPEEIKNLFK
ncbi:ankyrin repeat domain-containing protein [Kistimonas asteriae]|uniref:ankyrin repeat domain-containing protein n=1 Tax=Kistimonas asteriae TaxID=517724 RepID=UPI001BAC222C|nr:ankyrin repeat domain-containing protein [Kistimonas asteriae]